MKVFVSYASEDRPIAEMVVHSIRARNHTVFFDRDDLPAGETYEDQIEAAIERSDIFVFLISPHSVEPGGFALTELGMARKKWERPAGRVLPVMIGAIDYAKIPAYAKAVSVLEPEGNAAAETAARVDTMRRFPSRRLLSGALVLLLIAAGAAAYFLVSPRPAIAVVAKDPWPWERGYFGESGLYNLMLDIGNKGDLVGRLTAIRLVTAPAGALTITSQGPEYSTDTPSFVAPGASEGNHFVVKPAILDPSVITWRACVAEAIQGEICSQEQKWQPEHDFSPGTAFHIPAKLSVEAVAVARQGDGFVLVTKNPGMVYRIAPDGIFGASVPIPGEPTALYVDEIGVFVGTRGPDSLLKLGTQDLSIKASTAVAFPKEIPGGFGSPVSNTPTSIARGEGRIWIITRGGASGSGILHFATDLTDPQVPLYYAEMASDVDDMSLASNGERVWATRTNVTPASLYRFTPSAVKVYSGHDYGIASCASGVLVRTDDILVPDCRAWVQAVVEDDAGLRIKSQVGNLLGYKSDADIWTVVNMRPSAGDGAAFLVNSTRTTGSQVTSSVVNVLNPARGLKMPLDVEGITIVDLAAQEQSFMVILDDGKGRRETLALRYE